VPSTIKKKWYIGTSTTRTNQKKNEIDKRCKSKGGQYVKLAPPLKLCYFYK
jgi:hypothetical protein